MAGEHILIVESRGGVRDVLIDVIQLEGKVCTGVDTGQVALDQARRHRPDLMVVSLNLYGEMDGIDTIIAIRRDERLSSIPVVLLVDNFAGHEPPQIGDENLLVLKMADLDHLVTGMNCLLPTAARHDDPVDAATV